MAVTPGPAGASTPSVDYVVSTVKLTNLQRVVHNLPKLSRSDCLKGMAQAQARRMAGQGRMFHQDLSNVQHDCHMGWAGENVAYGFSTGAAVVQGWMASPGHRANILKRQYRLIGVGAVKADGVWWVAQVFGTRA